jgi:dipeptidyl aminopeptidase/acylaminoacyl peptidase
MQWRGALTGALLLASAQTAAAETSLHRFFAVAISPDGRSVASVETGAAPTNPALMIRPTAGGPAIPVAIPCAAGSACRVFSPVWAPDGQHIAFGVSAAGAKSRAIYTADPGGQNLRRILAFDGTIVALRYGPDGRLALLANADADKEVGPANAGAVETGEIGHIVHEQRIGIVADGALRWASPPDLFVYEYDWLPDGSGFAGTASPGDGDANWWSAKLYRFDAKRAEAQLLYAPATPRQQIAQPKVAPDGSAVSFIGGIMSDFENPGGDAFVLPLGAPGAVPVNRTATLPATVLTLRWACAPGRLLASMLRGADSQLGEIDAQGGAAPDAVWSGRSVINGADTAVSLACRAGMSATIRESFTAPPEIAVGPIGAWHDLTAANAAVARPALHARSVAWRSDGQDVQGWLLTPRDAPPTAKMPMITLAHGGPAAAEQTFFVSPGIRRALIEHGYALFLPNPRGSYGQGEAFTQANIRDFGHGDLRDILAGIDAALAAAPIDPDRLGLSGVSYGGFMAMWATTQTPRFKAAVARAGISDWLSYYGQNGIGGWLLPYFGASVYDNPAVYARSSPINFVKAAKTPTLLLVGDRDIECPPPQSQEFWHALRELGTPVSYVVYPGEGHDFWSATSSADVERRTIAWFDRYLR